MQNWGLDESQYCLPTSIHLRIVLSLNGHTLSLFLSLVILGVSFRLSQTNSKCKHLGHRHLFQVHLWFHSVAKSSTVTFLGLEHFYLLEINDLGIQEWDNHCVSAHLQSKPLTPRLWLSTHLASQMTDVLDSQISGLVLFNCRYSPYHLNFVWITTNSLKFLKRWE